MEDILFLQSEVADPYALYARRLAAGPAHYDAQQRSWAVYSHHACTAVLGNSDAHIPALPSLAAHRGPAVILLRNLVRLNNPPAHAGLRAIALRLFDSLRAIDTAALLQSLIDAQAPEFDWVETVCKKLPALALMHGLGMAAADIDFLLPRMAALAKIMLPQKTPAQLEEADTAAAEVWPVLDAHARRLTDTGDAQARTANLAGLLIQSCDAGRGLLANALLQALAHGLRIDDREQARKLVLETLRYDPPIQNTRRVLARNLRIGGETLRAGETVLVMLAAANRDPAVFERPAHFDTGRQGHEASLSFGGGAHACIAREFAVALAADTLAAAPVLSMPPQALRHEPLVNARLLRQLRVRPA